VVDFTGAFHRIDRAGLLPLPGRAIPIWFGGYADAALDRCARLGDGFIFGRASSGASRALEKVKAGAAEAGRDPESIGFEAIMPGDPPEWSGRLDQWRAAGGTHAAVLPDGMGATVIDGLQRCRESVADQMT
jgi:alkanesulfonate monooxygenase SsuD/methylene tetrahydromethanopterin reductase-like flavin-dependent oxidoreductase (luciferase family)